MAGVLLKMIAVNDAARSAPAPLSVGTGAHEGVLQIPGTFQLHFGGRLENVHVAWRLSGDNGPIVAALGGISAGRFVTGSNPRGWWSEIVGPGAALDTTR